MESKDEREFLLTAASWQDSLLQAYRSLHVMLQSILLAVGVGLSVIPLTLHPYPSHSLPALISCVLLVAIWLFHLWSSDRLRGIVLARGKDVTHWHHELVRLEQGLPFKTRHFTRFKFSQSGKHLSEHQLTDEQIVELLGVGLGHTRRIVDVSLFRGISLVWLLLVLASVGSVGVAYLGCLLPTQ